MNTRTVSLDEGQRMIHRVPLQLPIRVQGKDDQNEAWQEVTRLVDVTQFGAGFILLREVQVGRLLSLTMPLPRQLRCFDYTDEQYKTWSVVRSLSKISLENFPLRYRVGVAFIGKNPPSSYENNHLRTYDISSQNAQGLWNVVETSWINNFEKPPSKAEVIEEEKRISMETRLSMPLEITIEFLDEAGNIIAQELSVTQNISGGGACVYTSQEVEVGSFVLVKNAQYNVTIMSVVRSRRIGEDGIPRLHLQFVDQNFPLEGIC